MRRRVVLLSFLIALTLGVTGCPRYETVRKLSSEQLRVQEGFQDTITKYFKSMEEFAQNQIIVDKLYYDDLAEQKQDLLRRRARRDLSQIPADAADGAAQRDKRNELLGREIQTSVTQNDLDKKELDDALLLLKAKHQEILSAYQTILDAQRQLNEYIQLKKADEVIVEQLLGKIKVNQQKVTRLFDEAANIADKIKVKPDNQGTTAAGGNNDD
jgi:hypothetical protein